MYERIEDIRVRALELALANDRFNYSKDDTLANAREFEQFIMTGKLPRDHVFQPEVFASSAKKPLGRPPVGVPKRPRK